MENWSLVENQPLLKAISKMPLIISCGRGKSIKDMLVRAKTQFKGFDNSIQPIKHHVESPCTPICDFL